MEKKREKALKITFKRFNTENKSVHPLILSKKVINILVTFDSKLQWSNHIATVSSKALKALNAIRIIKRFFTKRELLQLITSNVYSILYYNSEIWHLPTLKSELKHKLVSISARAIKTCMYYPDNMISFKNIHKMNNRAMPEAIMHYKHAIQLFKIYNSNEFTFNWLLLNFNQIFNSRQTTFKAFKSNNAKVGLNLLANRLTILNGKIPFSWLNELITLFKLKCKKLFLMD